MEAIGARQYVIELYVHERWQEFYRTPERRDAEGVWERVLETQPRNGARMVEVEILRSSTGEATTDTGRL